VLRSGATLALIGAAIGLLGAVAVSRLFEAAFPGIRTDAVPVLAGATLMLVAIAQVACYLPARNASRISPAETLRAE
jgi:putative ABC transport system permease protein